MPWNSCRTRFATACLVFDVSERSPGIGIMVHCRMRLLLKSSNVLAENKMENVNDKAHLPVLMPIIYYNGVSDFDQWHLITDKLVLVSSHTITMVNIYFIAKFKTPNWVQSNVTSYQFVFTTIRSSLHV